MVRNHIEGWRHISVIDNSRSKIWTKSPSAPLEERVESKKRLSEQLCIFAEARVPKSLRDCRSARNSYLRKLFLPSFSPSSSSPPSFFLPRFFQVNARENSSFSEKSASPLLQYSVGIIFIGLEREKRYFYFFRIMWNRTRE